VLPSLGSVSSVVADRAAGAEAGVEAAIFGFSGVVCGSVSTTALTFYKERVTGRRELEQRDRQYERERAIIRDVFQRDSVLTLQTSDPSVTGQSRLRTRGQRRRWPARQFAGDVP
jgi:hypothetical protein